MAYAVPFSVMIFGDEVRPAVRSLSKVTMQAGIKLRLKMEFFESMDLMNSHLRLSLRALSVLDS